MAASPSAAPTLTAGQEIELQKINRGGVQAPALITEATGPLDEVKESTHKQPIEVPSADAGSLTQQQDDDSIPRWPFACLVLQHASSAWTARTWEFCGYLFLTALFPASFVPAALLGLLTTSAGLVFSGWVGGLVDDRRRLPFVRSAIGVQKLSVAAAYALFIVLFVPLRKATKSVWATPGSDLTPAEEAARAQHWAVALVLALIIVAGSTAGLATGGLNTAIERDWVMTLAGDRTRKLTTFNTWLRRIDLLCTLLAPLLVSAFTSATSYEFTLYFYLGFTVLSTGFEYVWIAIVYKAFPVLAEEETGRQARNFAAREQKKASGRRSARQLVEAGKENWRQTRFDWADFARQPIFLSSVTLALIFLQTLSFDGIMISYLKSQRDFSDAFIAGMRGVSVIMGLVGTAVMPFMERRMGLVRGGAWSLWFEIVCLVPVTLCLFIGLPLTDPAGKGDTWNVAIFFTFISLSRIGLWAFDLFQLQQLQEALKDHPRRNRLTAFQLSLTSLFDLGKYGMVLGWSSPADFKWTAVVSLSACLIAGGVYGVYVQRMRGHIFHFQKLPDDKPGQEGVSTAAVPSHWKWKAPAKPRQWGEGVTRRKVETPTSEATVGVTRVQSTS